MIFSSGGVVLASRDGKIVCENTLDARLDVVFRKKLPEVKKKLHSSSYSVLLDICCWILYTVEFHIALTQITCMQHLWFTSLSQDMYFSWVVLFTSFRNIIYTFYWLYRHYNQLKMTFDLYLKPMSPFSLSIYVPLYLLDWSKWSFSLIVPQTFFLLPNKCTVPPWIHYWPTFRLYYILLTLDIV